MKRFLRWGMVAVAVLGFVVGASGPAQAGGNLVANGDFATGDFTDWTLGGDSSFAYVSGSPGNFVATLTTTGAGEGTLSQSLATVAGTEYVVSFALASDGATPNSLAVTLGGTTVASLSNVPGPPTPLLTYTYDITASAAPSVLQFVFVDVPGNLYLTNISVTAAVSAVPEPATVVCPCQAPGCCLSAISGGSVVRSPDLTPANRSGPGTTNIVFGRRSSVGMNGDLCVARVSITFRA